MQAEPTFVWRIADIIDNPAFAALVRDNKPIAAARALITALAAAGYSIQLDEAALLRKESGVALSDEPDRGTFLSKWERVIKGDGSDPA